MWRLVIALLSCSLGVARAVRDSDLGLLLDVEETGRSEGQEIGESQMTVEEYFNFGWGRYVVQAPASLFRASILQNGASPKNGLAHQAVWRLTGGERDDGSPAFKGTVEIANIRVGFGKYVHGRMKVWFLDDYLFQIEKHSPPPTWASKGDLLMKVTGRGTKRHLAHYTGKTWIISTNSMGSHWDVREGSDQGQITLTGGVTGDIRHGEFNFWRLGSPSNGWQRSDTLATIRRGFLDAPTEDGTTRRWKHARTPPELTPRFDVEVKEGVDAFLILCIAQIMGLREDSLEEHSAVLRALGEAKDRGKHALGTLKDAVVEQVGKVKDRVVEHVGKVKDSINHRKQKPPHSGSSHDGPVVTDSDRVY